MPSETGFLNEYICGGIFGIYSYLKNLFMNQMSCVALMCAFYLAALPKPFQPLACHLPPALLQSSAPWSPMSQAVERKWPHRGATATASGLGAIRGADGTGAETPSTRPTMTWSHRPPTPALAPILLAMLLGGEWGHTSICLSLGVCSCLSTCPGPSSPWGWDHGNEETPFQRRLRLPGVRLGPEWGSPPGDAMSLDPRPSWALQGFAEPPTPAPIL